MMANLSTTPVFNDEIYQLETSDPLLGGAPVIGSPSKQGIDNWQGLQLLQSTLYLKKLTDMVEYLIGEAGETLVLTDNTLLYDAVANLIQTLSAGGNVSTYWCGAETGTNANFQISPVNTSFPDPLPAGMVVVFTVSGTPTTGALCTITIEGIQYPLVKNGIQQLASELKTNEVVVAVFNGTRFTRVNASEHPPGYLVAPCPEYVAPRQIRMNGTLAARGGLNQDDIYFSGNQIVDLDVDGLNGLNGATPAANTTYHLFGLQSTDGASGGYRFYDSTAETQVNFGGRDYIRRRLPLSFQTDGSGNIRPFFVRHWLPTEALIEFTGANGSVLINSGAQVVGDLNVANITSLSSASNTTIDLSAFVPDNAHQTLLRLAHGDMPVERFLPNGGSYKHERYDFSQYTYGSAEVLHPTPGNKELVVKGYAGFMRVRLDVDVTGYGVRL